MVIYQPILFKIIVHVFLIIIKEVLAMQAAFQIINIQLNDTLNWVGINSAHYNIWFDGLIF